MTTIELFAGEDFGYFGTLPLAAILRPTVSRMLGIPESAEFATLLTMYPVATDSAPVGTPAVYNLVPDYGYAKVIVVRDRRIVYQHPHPVEDLVANELQRFLAAQYPDVSMWGFRIAAEGMPAARFVRPTPVVEGVANVRPFGPGERPAFGIRPIAEVAPPQATLAELGVSRPTAAPQSPGVRVVVPAAVRDDLTTRPFSTEVEEGGFLVGKVFRDRDVEDAFLLLITRAERAEHTGASLLHFTFSGDSFGAVKRSLRGSEEGDRLLGWYHTHLFAATDDFGLSSIDVRLHFSTFQIPWQVAGLINLEDDQRTLRFYVRRGAKMVLCPFVVADVHAAAAVSNGGTSIGDHDHGKGGTPAANERGAINHERD